MDYDELLVLIDRLEKSNIEYLDYAKGDDRVVLSKEVPTHNLTPSQTQMNATIDNETAISNSVTDVETGQTMTKSQATPIDETVVNAPMIGVAYLQNDPEESPFVKVGDKVNKGDVVCIIEAMKLMNEIQSPVSGTVTEILVNNEDVVEYNQPLIRIQ